MSEHHFFTEPADLTATQVTIRGSGASHAFRSLRIREGEEITVADNAGRMVRARVTAAGADQIDAAVVSDIKVEPVRVEVELWQAVIKDGLDEVLRIATELGIQSFGPFTADRSIPRWDEGKREKALERLRAVALSSAKQCRCPRVPAVHPVAKSLSPPADDALTIVLHPEAVTGLRSVLGDEPNRKVRLVVGPEGSLSDAEVNRLVADGAVAATMGRQVFRSVTAAAVAVSIVNTHYGVIG